MPSNGSFLAVQIEYLYFKNNDEQVALLVVRESTFEKT